MCQNGTAETHSAGIQLEMVQEGASKTHSGKWSLSVGTTAWGYRELREPHQPEEQIAWGLQPLAHTLPTLGSLEGVPTSLAWATAAKAGQLSARHTWNCNLVQLWQGGGTAFTLAKFGVARLLLH